MREGGDQEGGPPASRRRGDRVGGGRANRYNGADARPCRYSSDLSHASTLSHAPRVATF